MSSFFDEQAATWDDDPVKVERAQVVARAITDVLGLDGSQRLFEYGAGTGLVAQALRDVVGSITLADTSAGMRDVMDAKVAAGVLPGARVWDLDLEHQPGPDEQFEVVATVLALHHLHDVPTVLGRFADLLAPGGAVCIVDRG
jgi:ubiquinone/menaquinone biosynthesis C-methylase UbiE